jgi:hypothetical protein
MKTIILLMGVALLIGCRVTVEPKTTQTHEPSKPRVHRSPHHQRFYTVDAQWIERYRQNEKEAGDYNVTGDEQIRAEGQRYVVPRSVVQHYEDMSRAKSKESPAPTPTP